MLDKLKKIIKKIKKKKRKIKPQTKLKSRCEKENKEDYNNKERKTPNNQ